MEKTATDTIDEKWKSVDPEHRNWFFGSYEPQDIYELVMMTSIIKDYQSVKALRKTNMERFKAMRRSIRDIGQVLNKNDEPEDRNELLRCMAGIVRHLRRLELRAKKAE